MGLPSFVTLCSTTHMPVLLSTDSDMCENQCTSAQKYLTLLCVKEKNSQTRAMSRPSIPGESRSVSTKLQSCRGGPFLHESIAWIRSQHIPPMPEMSLGEKNVATADGYAVIFSLN